LIEEVKVIDIFENDKKFWSDKKSVCMRITFRSLEKTLTNEEINIMYFKIRDKLEQELSYHLR
jgi:phenylalanyl-tRNA synthetase alpha chain